MAAGIRGLLQRWMTFFSVTGSTLFEMSNDPGAVHPILHECKRIERPLIHIALRGGAQRLDLE